MEREVVGDLGFFCDGFHGEHVSDELFLETVFLLEFGSIVLPCLLEKQVEIIPVDVILGRVLVDVFDVLAVLFLL